VNSNPRQINLLETVRTRGSVTVEELAEMLGVTLQTVRRDVQRLADEGLLTRFHGGVRVPSSTTENIGYQQRETLHAEGKARIARRVAELVPNDCSLILNIGTTTEAVAKALLRHTGLRVITNNLNVATILSGNSSCEVIVAGGSLRDFDLREVKVAQTIIAQAREVWLAADASKFNRPAMIQLGTLSQIDRLFTDAEPPPPFTDLLLAAQVRLEIASEN